MPRQRVTTLDELLRLMPHAAAKSPPGLRWTYWLDLRYRPRRDPDNAWEDERDWQFAEIVLRRYGDKVVAVWCKRYRNGARLFIYFEEAARGEVRAYGARLVNPHR